MSKEDKEIAQEIMDRMAMYFCEKYGSILTEMHADFVKNGKCTKEVYIDENGDFQLREMEAKPDIKFQGQEIQLTGGTDKGERYYVGGKPDETD